MFQPISAFIGLRYTRAKRKNHFISFISFSSMLGIALGVAILITVLSIMNGFGEVIRERIFSVARQVTISGFDGFVSHAQSLSPILEQHPSIVSSAPFVNAQALLTHHGLVRPTLLMGIEPNKEKQVTDIEKNMSKGTIDDLIAGQFGIVLGRELIEAMGLQIGDKVIVITPEMAVTPIGALPRFKRFTLVGEFSIGAGFGFDGGLGYIHLNDAQKLLQLNQNVVSGIRLKLTDLLRAPIVAQELREKLNGPFYISNWTDDYGEFFHFVQLEKTMMFFVLLLIVAIAAFNLVSSLVMTVSDKNADIAIMRTIGATPSMIMRVFLIQGSIIGIIGTLLGLAGGIALALNTTEVAGFLEKILHIKFLSSSVYFVNYVPSKLMLIDILKICTVALIMSFLATLYPAWRASRVQPAEALRYE